MGESRAWERAGCLLRMLRWWLLFLPYLLRVGSHGLAEGEEENYRRQIHVQFNSTYNGTTVNLLHIRAVGQKDTIHYVWSTLGAPTMLLVHTNSAESTLQLDWTKLVSSSPFQGIRIEPLSSVQHSMAVMFTRVFEYYDVNNTADFSHTAASNFYPAYKLADFVWERGDSTFNATTRTAVFRGSSASDTRLFQNGSISFRMARMVSNAQNESRAQSFMQWKMVAYGSPVARRDEALPCQYYDLQEWNRTKTLPSVVAQAFFGENLMENCTIQALNLSFGIADGDFYNKNHFLSWWYRLVAYRCFTWWLHGRLGHRVRRVIPACAVLAIRQHFPSDSGQYRGFSLDVLQPQLYNV